MKLRLLMFVCALFFTYTVSAQWLQRANFPGTSRSKSTAFTIGDKIYLMGGVSNSSVILHDFWEYDIPSNTWTAKPAFPGPERYGAVSFVVNNKGYIATGGNDFGYLDDLWEYNPGTGNWIQRTGLPAGSAQHENQRREAYAFVIGNKAYLGGGDGFVFGPNSTNPYSFFDLWEYNPLNDSWTTRADIPDFTGRDFSIGASINGKGYAGLGCNVQQNVNHPGFWEYDPVTNAWTARATFPNNFTTDAGAFVVNGELYVVGGVNLNPVSLSNQVYKFDPVANTWTQLSVFNGGAIAGEFAVSTGSTAFIGTGYNGNIVTRSDVWETNFTTGVDENMLSGNETFSVYPNPSADVIHLKLNSMASEESYMIADACGREVLNGILSVGNTAIRISDLPSGLYIIRTETSGLTTKFFRN